MIVRQLRVALKQRSRPTTAVINACSQQFNRPTIRLMSRKSEQLPSESDAQRSDLSKWFTTKMDQLQRHIFTAGQTLNDFTGYSSIEKIKKDIEQSEQALKKCREEVVSSKEAYTNAVTTRSNSQKELNELLQRKSNWTPEDLQRFTDLFRNDHAYLKKEEDAKQLMNEKEKEFEDRRVVIAKLISARYHEEQVWSDKIRRASTYGTWGLMGFNIVLFVVVQLGLEPWKRRRLVGSFEDKVKSALDNNRIEENERLESLQQEFERQFASPSSGEQHPPSNDKLPAIGWSSYLSRVATSIETSSTLVTNASELFSSLAVTTVLGALLGSLVTLAFIR